MIKPANNIGRAAIFQSPDKVSVVKKNALKAVLNPSGKKKNAVPQDILLKNGNMHGICGTVLNPLATCFENTKASVNVEKLRNKVLDIVSENFEYFRENPKHLAWAMMNYELLHRVGRRYFDDCWDNPKYPVIELGEKIDKDPRHSNTSKIKNSDLIYDAWAVTVSNSDEFPDVNPKLPLEAKKDKTMEDWISLFTDKRYKYNDLFSDARSVRDYLLCVIGTGYGWNENGFLTKSGPSGVDEIIFAGHTKAENEVRKDIKDQVNKLYKNPVLAEKVIEYMKKVGIYAGDNEAEKTMLDEEWKLEEEIQNLPQAEKAKIKDAFRYICYLEAICNEAKHWTDDEWAKAKKSNMYDYHRTKFDISEASLDFSRSSYLFITSISMIQEQGENFAVTEDYRVDRFMRLRRMLWRDFINQVDDPKDPEVVKVQKIVSELSKKELAEIFNPEKKVLTDRERAELKAAREYLDARRPNKKYQKLYDIVEDLHKKIQGTNDMLIIEQAKKEAKEAVDTLDKLSGVPEKGWDTIYFISKKSGRFINNHISELENNSGSKKSRTYYPLSEYSNLVRMPENAHPGYVEAGILISKEILANPDEPEESKKYARQFLSRVQKS